MLADICHEEHLHTFSKGFVRDYCTTCEAGGRLCAATGPPSRLTDAVVALTRTWRFEGGGAIARLSAAFRDGKADEALAILHEPHDDLAFQALSAQGGLEAALAPVVEHAVQALQAAGPEDAFAAWGALQLLTPLRRGPFGVEGLNELLAEMLRARRAVTGRGWWHQGRPVMVRRNAPALRLFNGDIGVALQDPHGQLKVFFRKDQGFRTLPPARLQDVEAIYAMTVHKSQGSEFEAVLLLLPDQDSPVLTRELLYTALTRAKTRATVAGNPEILQKAIARRVSRHSGLRSRLWGRQRPE